MWRTPIAWMFPRLSFFVEMSNLSCTYCWGLHGYIVWNKKGYLAGRSSFKEEIWHCYGDMIEVLPSFIYLGLPFNSSRNVSYSCKDTAIKGNKSLLERKVTLSRINIVQSTVILRYVIQFFLKKHILFQYDPLILYQYT